MTFFCRLVGTVYGGGLISSLSAARQSARPQVASVMFGQRFFPVMPMTPVHYKHTHTGPNHTGGLDTTDLPKGQLGERGLGGRAVGGWKDINDLLEGNRVWVEAVKKEDPKFFENLKKGHTPHFLYIGCSDARVPANSITGTHPNELFVHRNIANLVVASDMNLQSVIQYAVEYLEVPHIIVCGHYDCGGVRAAMQVQDHGLIAGWLANIRDVYRLHAKELDAIEDLEERHRRLVEINVVEQVLNVFKIGVVQRKRLESHRMKGPDSKYKFATPRIHGLVYDPGEGVLKALDINWKENIRKLQHVYDLYELPPSTDATPPAKD